MVPQYFERTEELAAVKALFKYLGEDYPQVAEIALKFFTLPRILLPALMRHSFQKWKLTRSSQ